MTNAQRIRDVLKDKGVLVMPGVYDCLSAKIASRAGFEVIFITGYSVSATFLGEPDFGLLTQTELLSASQRICSVTDRPVIVDCDTGYGNAVNVIRTVKELIRGGAAGCLFASRRLLLVGRCRLASCSEILGGGDGLCTLA